MLFRMLFRMFASDGLLEGENDGELEETIDGTLDGVLEETFGCESDGVLGELRRDARRVTPTDARL